MERILEELYEGEEFIDELNKLFRTRGRS